MRVLKKKVKAEVAVKVEAEARQAAEERKARAGGEEKVKAEAAAKAEAEARKAAKEKADHAARMQRNELERQDASPAPQTGGATRVGWGALVRAVRRAKDRGHSSKARWHAFVLALPVHACASGCSAERCHCGGRDPRRLPSWALEEFLEQEQAAAREATKNKTAAGHRWHPAGALPDHHHYHQDVYHHMYDDRHHYDHHDDHDDNYDDKQHGHYDEYHGHHYAYHNDDYHDYYHHHHDRDGWE